MNKVALLNGNVLEMYTSIETAPLRNFQAYNKFALVEAGIGGDLGAINSHISLISGYISHKQGDKAQEQLKNYAQALQFIVSGTTPEMLCFVPLVYKLNGEVFNCDFSEEGIQEALVNLSKRGLTMGKIRGFLSFFKKKVDSEFDALFPKLVNTPEVQSYYDLLQKRTLYVLDRCIGKDVEEQINNVEGKMFKILKPKNFIGKDSAEVKFILDFEDAKAAISRHLHLDPNKMTVLSFYRNLDNINKMNRPKQNNKKRSA